jgi:hypothetical protein
MIGTSYELSRRWFGAHPLVRVVRALAFVLAMAIVVPLAACSSSSPNEPPAPDGGCSAEWPRRLDPRTTSAAGRQYLKDIVACGNEETGGLSLTNNSDLIWGFYDPSAASSIQPLTQSGAVAEFHVLAHSLYPYAFMAPSETVSVQGGVDNLEWAIHPELSAAWTTNDFLLKQLGKKSEAAAKLAFTENSASRKMMWDCTKAVYEIGVAAPRIIQSSSYDPAEQISTGLGLATPTGTCARSWNAAERESGSARVSTWAQLADEAGSALKPAAELGEKSSFLKKAVLGTLPLICKVYTRC